MWFYRIYLKLKKLVFESWICPARLWRSTGMVNWTSNRSMCTRRAQRPSDLADRPCGRPTEVSPLSGAAGRPGGRLFTLARSTGRSTGQRAVALWIWYGRLGGRPEGSTVKNVTVGQSTGRSTGRAFWPFSAANGQISNGAINTPFEVGFLKYFSLLFDFQTPWFSHTWAYLIILSIGSLFSEKWIGLGLR